MSADAHAKGLRRPLAMVLVLVASLAVSAPTPAVAQPTAEPQEWDPEASERFRRCRAVALLHLQAQDWSKAVVDEDHTRALLQQINLVMTETLMAQPPDSVEDSDQRVLFVEQYFINMREIVTDAAQRFQETAARDQFLLDCAPFVWRVLSRRVDELIKWRTLALGDNAPGYRFRAPSNGDRR